jgi:hypothetical protein
MASRGSAQLSRHRANAFTADTPIRERCRREFHLYLAVQNENCR